MTAAAQVAAMARVRSLALELPHAVSVAKKKKDPNLRVAANSILNIKDSLCVYIYILGGNGRRRSIKSLCCSLSMKLY